MVQTLQHERDALRHRLHQLQQQPPTDNNGHDEEVPNSTGTDWQDAYYQQWLSKPSTKVAWDAHIQEAQSQWETQHVRPLQQEIEHRAAKITHLQQQQQQQALLLVHSTTNQTKTTDSSTNTTMGLVKSSTLLVAQQQLLQQEEWRLERETLEQECLELQRQLDQATAQIAAASASRTTTANQESSDTQQQQHWQERLREQQREYTQTWQARRVHVSEAKQIAKAAVRTAQSRAHEAVSTWHAAQQELFQQKQELQHLQQDEWQEQEQQNDNEDDKEQEP